MRILTFVLAVAAILCGTVLAQQVDTLNVHFNSPVAVSESTLPAGDCNIQIVRGSGDNVTLVFRSGGQTVTALVNRIYQDEEAGEGVRLVLRRGASGNRLDRVLMGDGTGFQLLGRE